MRVLFAKEYRWQCWLDVEAALAVAEAQCGVIPAAAAQAIGSAARGVAETDFLVSALFVRTRAGWKISALFTTIRNPE